MRMARAQSVGIEARRQDLLRRGEGLWLATTDWRDAVRYNGLGRYDDAVRRRCSFCLRGCRAAASRF